MCKTRHDRVGVSAHNPETVAGVTARTFKLICAGKEKWQQSTENRDHKAIKRTDKLNGDFSFHYEVITSQNKQRCTHGELSIATIKKMLFPATCTTICLLFQIALAIGHCGGLPSVPPASTLRRLMTDAKINMATAITSTRSTVRAET